MDPAKRAKALSKKIKKLETVQAKKDAGEAINAVGLIDVGWYLIYVFFMYIYTCTDHT